MHDFDHFNQRKRANEKSASLCSACCLLNKRTKIISVAKAGISIGFVWALTKKMQYQGQILDGQMHGTGKLTYENGEYYDGEWVRGNIT